MPSWKSSFTNLLLLVNTDQNIEGLPSLPEAHTHIQRCSDGSQHAHCSHQVHGGAAWRMWLNKQLRWRLSKALDLRLCGLRERARE